MNRKKNQTGKRVHVINMAERMHEKNRLRVVSPSEITIKLGRYTLKTTPIADIHNIQSVEGVSIPSGVKIIKPNKTFVVIGKALQNTHSKTLTRLGNDIMGVVE